MKQIWLSILALAFLWAAVSARKAKHDREVHFLNHSNITMYVTDGKTSFTLDNRLKPSTFCKITDDSYFVVTKFDILSPTNKTLLAVLELHDKDFVTIESYDQGGVTNIVWKLTH